MHTWSPGVGEHSLYYIAPDSFESTSGMSSWGVLTTTLNILDSRTLGFSGLAGPSQHLVTPARSREVGVAFDYRHTWFIPEAWERSSRYWWLSFAVSIPEVFLFFPDVLSNGIELDATEPADNPVLETLQNINPINHVVQAVYSIPRKSTLGVSLGNSLCPWSGLMKSKSDAPALEVRGLGNQTGRHRESAELWDAFPGLDTMQHHDGQVSLPDDGRMFVSYSPPVCTFNSV